METVILLLWPVLSTVLFFFEREKSKRLEAQVSTLVKMRDLNELDNTLEPLADYNPEPIPDYMLEHVRDFPGTAPADTRGLSDGPETGIKKRH